MLPHLKVNCGPEGKNGVQGDEIAKRETSEAYSVKNCMHAPLNKLQGGGATVASKTDLELPSRQDVRLMVLLLPRPRHHRRNQEAELREVSDVELADHCWRDLSAEVGCDLSLNGWNG